MTYPELESIVKQAKCKRKKKTKLPTRQQLKRRKKKAESQESNMSIQQDSGFVEKFAEAVVRARDARMEKEASKAAIIAKLTALFGKGGPVGKHLGTAKQSIGKGLGTAKNYLTDVSGKGLQRAKATEQAARVASPMGGDLLGAAENRASALTRQAKSRAATKAFARSNAPLAAGLGAGGLLTSAYHNRARPQPQK